MKKILLLLALVVGWFVISPILSNYYDYFVAKVADKPEFILDEDPSDVQNYQQWLAWVRACHPTRNYLYKTLDIQTWYEVETSWFNKTYFYPKEVYSDIPRSGCPPYEAWITGGFDTPFGFSEIPLKNGTRYRVPNTYLEPSWIQAHRGLYKEGNMRGSMSGVFGIQNLFPMAWLTNSSLHALRRTDESIIYTVTFSANKSYEPCPIEYRPGMCVSEGTKVEIIPYWGMIQSLPYLHGIAPRVQGKYGKTTPKLEYYRDNPELFKEHVGGVHYDEKLQASYIYLSKMDRVRRNNPYSVLYFTGDIFYPDSWVRCQHLKTDDGKQPIILGEDVDGTPMHRNLNACMSKIKFHKDGSARVLFQSPAMAGYTLNEFVDRLHSKLASFVVEAK